MNENERRFYSHVVWDANGNGVCYVTGLSAPCSCFACAASARRADEERAKNRA